MGKEQFEKKVLSMLAEISAIFADIRADMNAMDITMTRMEKRAAQLERDIANMEHKMDRMNSDLDGLEVGRDRNLGIAFAARAVNPFSADNGMGGMVPMFHKSVDGSIVPEQFELGSYREYME